MELIGFILPKVSSTVHFRLRCSSIRNLRSRVYNHQLLGLWRRGFDELLNEVTSLSSKQARLAGRQTGSVHDYRAKNCKNSQPSKVRHEFRYFIPEFYCALEEPILTVWTLYCLVNGKSS